MTKRLQLRRKLADPPPKPPPAKRKNVKVQRYEYHRPQPDTLFGEPVPAWLEREVIAWDDTVIYHPHGERTPVTEEMRRTLALIMADRYLPTSPPTPEYPPMEDEYFMRGHQNHVPKSKLRYIVESIGESLFVLFLVCVVMVAVQKGCT